MDEKDPFGLKNNENMLDLTKSDDTTIEILENNKEDKKEPSLTYYEDHISLEKPRYEELTAPIEELTEAIEEGTQIIDLAVVSEENNENAEDQKEETPVYALIPVILEEESTEKKPNIFAKLFAKFRKSKKTVKQDEDIGAEVIIIDDKPPKKKSNLKVLIPILGVVILVAGVNFGLKSITGSDLMETIKNGFGDKKDVVASVPNPIVSNPSENPNQGQIPMQPNDPNEQIPVDPNQPFPSEPTEFLPTDPSIDVAPQPIVDNPDIIELKTNIETLEASFLSLKFNLEDVEMIEPTIFVKGTIGSKKANMVEMNRLVREIQMKTSKELKRPYTSVQVQLTRGANVYAWETTEKVVSYIERLHYEDRHSSQFWWDRSRVTADGLNYKTTLNKINLYVPSANPIWPKPEPTTEPTDGTDGEGTTNEGGTSTATTLRFCTNDSMNTDSKCKLPTDADKEKLKDFFLSFDYPASFAFTVADKKIDTISTISLINSKPSTTETIKDMSVFVFKSTELNTTLTSLFNTFTNAFEANNSSYKYTSSTPVDLDYLSKNNVAMKGRVYETKIDDKKKYVFVVIGYKDNEGYAFSLLVDDYLTNSDAIRKFVSNVELGKPTSDKSDTTDKSANNVVFYNPETGKIEYK